MNSTLKCEPMVFCHLYLQTEVAFNCVLELGEVGLVQFNDANKDLNLYQRKFITEVRRCENMERILRYLEEQIIKNKIEIIDKGEDRQILNPRLMSDMEHKLESLEKEVKQINTSYENLLIKYRELTELKHLLRKAHSFFEVVDRRISEYENPEENDDVILSIDDREFFELRPRQQRPRSSIKLNFIGGVIAKNRVLSFQLMLFRVCRGNALLKYADIEVPLEDLETGFDVNKSVFLVFFQGEQLRINILKVCEGFHCNIYPCPDTQAERRDMSLGLMTRLEDLNIVLKQTQDHLLQVISILAVGQHRDWFCKVHKLKMIYHVLNQFNYDITQKCLIIECWCPAKDVDEIRRTLHKATNYSGANDSAAILQHINTHVLPPTYHKVDEFTLCVQEIIDSYGISSYQEINPAPFSIITFPFLFSVMFGDIGHGLIVFISSIFLIIFNKKLQKMSKNNEFLSILSTGRYMILLMGLFSIYAGFIYNDLFGKCIKISSPSWSVNNLKTNEFHSQSISLDPAKPEQYLNSSIYALGMDPTWQISQNKINFLNSFKMKLSIIIGVTHMTFAIILSLFNHIHNRDIISIVSDFIPRIIFFFLLFGYLIVLIFRKWIFYDASMVSPSLLIGFINMFLNVYPSEPDYLVVGPKQKILQQCFLVIALFCVPWMLFLKPYLLHRQHKTKTIANSFTNLAKLFQSDNFTSTLPSRNANNSINDEHLILLDHTEEDQYTQINVMEDVDLDAAHQISIGSSSSIELIQSFKLGESLIHQAIHTIEFCLGSISHTASYLRLWALSLAHAQLSEVLWHMILHNGLVAFGDSKATSLTIFITFYIWAFLSFCILVVMEGLSAFLHTLRLHWVEFMSKFYLGEGRPFDPFKFTQPNFRSDKD